MMYGGPTLWTWARSFVVIMMIVVVAIQPLTASVGSVSAGDSDGIKTGASSSVETTTNTVLVVNQSNSSNYDSIQNAIENASPGAIIEVKAGIYNESVFINKSITLEGDPGNARPGTGSDPPELDSDGTRRNAINLVDGVSNVTITGFEIREYTSNGIRAPTATENITITDNHIHRVAGGDWSTGITTRFPQNEDHQRWQITGNVIQNVSFASIHLANARHSRIEKNVISGGQNLGGSLSNNSTIGIAIQSRSQTIDNRVSNITVQNNTVTGTLDAAGIMVLAWNETNSTRAQVDNVSIRGNEITGIRDEGPSYGGISIRGETQNVTITDIEVAANGINESARAVYVNDANQIEITRNYIQGSGHGIEVQGSSDIQITSNQIVGTTSVPGDHNHSAFGAAVIADDSGNASNVNISYNEMTGVFTQFGGVINLWAFADQTNATVQSAVIKSNRLTGTFNGSPGTRGVNLFSDGNVSADAFGNIRNITIRENAVSGSIASGIGIGAGSQHATTEDVLVAGNRINRSGKGVSVFARNEYRIRDIRIEQNRLSEVRRAGVLVVTDGEGSAADVEVRRNEIYNTTGTRWFSGNGIEFVTWGNSKQRNTSIAENLVSNTTGSGVNIVPLENGSHSNVTVRLNRFNKTERPGINFPIAGNLSDVLVERNLVEKTNATGVNLIGFEDGQVREIEVRENLVSNTTHQGISATASANSSQTNVTITSNAVNHTAHDGIFVRSKKQGNTSSVRVIQNLVSDVKAGVTVDANGNGTTRDINVTLNLARYSQIGLFLHARDAGHLTEVEVHRNAFRNNTDEGLFLGPIDNAIVDHVRITENSITDNTDGGLRVIERTSVGTITIRDNRITGNEPFGLKNAVKNRLNASHNYWGASDGPGGVFNGSGDAVFGNVTVSPFYTDANRTSLASNITRTGIVVNKSDPNSFDTIQNAINNASTGATVNVTAGTYNETVVINKSINLVGDPDSAKVGPGPNAPILASNLTKDFAIKFTEGASNVTVKGFVIREYNDTGIGASMSNPEPSRNLVIRDNYINNITDFGISTGHPQSEMHSRWRITNNVIDDTGFEAIHLANTLNSAIDGNFIRGGTNPPIKGVGTTNSSWGIVVESLSWDNNTTLSNITVENNTVTGPFDGEGISVFGTNLSAETSAVVDNISIYDNTITNAGEAGGPSGAIDILVWPRTIPTTENVSLRDIEVVSNEISQSTNGIFYENVTNGLIADNRIEGGGRGLDLNGISGDVVIHNNTITNATNGGIRVTANSALVKLAVRQNRLNGNSPFGLRNLNATQLNATHNYWGASDGPSGDFNGSGDAVVGNVTVSPFYSDADLSTLMVEDSTPPIISNATIIDADGNNDVSDSEQVDIFVNVTDENSGVRTVTADASAFGGSTVVLIDNNKDGIYRGNFTADVDTAPSTGNQSVIIKANDTAGNSATPVESNELNLLDPTTVDGGQPGFGLGIAVIGIILAGLFAVRRQS